MQVSGDSTKHLETTDESKQGQANHFFRVSSSESTPVKLTCHQYAPEKIPYGVRRYQTETRRLYGVLETRLADREWLVGPHYSLADIKTMPWVDLGAWAGVDPENGDFPNVAAWLARCNARPATAVCC
jgi:glutathione S-transferase